MCNWTNVQNITTTDVAYLVPPHYMLYVHRRSNICRCIPKWKLQERDQEKSTWLQSRPSPKKFKSSSEQEVVVALFPAFDFIRGSLNRHRNAACTPVPDARNIPDDLRITFRGKELPEGDEHHERFFLHSSADGRMHVFCADTELSILHQSEYIICDETFEMAPD